jgi:hypothetical protein
MRANRKVGRICSYCRLDKAEGSQSWLLEEAEMFVCWMGVDSYICWKQLSLLEAWDLWVC